VIVVFLIPLLVKEEMVAEKVKKTNLEQLKSKNVLKVLLIKKLKYLSNYLYL